MLIKEFSIDQTDEARGFPLLSVLHYENGRATSPLLKTASARRVISDDVQAYIDKMGSDPRKLDKVAIFVSALGSDKSWGPNRRHDGWPQEDLMHKGADYGFQTFMQGHTYLHHRNSSPDLAVGKIIYASANPRMDRVELIQTIDRSRAPELCARIDDGEYIQTSMGAKVAHDICSLPWCRHIAKVAADHCEHIKLSGGKVYEGGYQAYMVNPKPRFFENSAVKTGAARESGMLMKVAHDTSALQGELLFGKDAETEKESFLRKRIDLDFQPVRDENRLEDPVAMMGREDEVAEVQSYAPLVGNLLDTEPLLPESVLEKASSLPLTSALSTFSGVGIAVRPEEFQYLFLSKAGYRKEASVLYKLGFLLDAPPPGESECQTEDRVHYDHVQPKLAEALEPYIAGRTALEPYLSQRVSYLAAQTPEKLAEMETKTRLVDSLGAQWSTPGIMAALALGYGVYRHMAPADRTLRTAEKAFRKHPWLVPLFLASGAWGIRNVGEAALQKGPTEENKKKVAGLMGTVSTFALPIGGAYLLSASAKRKEWEGYPLGTVEKIIRDYPMVVGPAGAVAAGRLRGKMRGIGQALAKASSLAKTAGVLEDALLYTGVGWYSPYRFHAALADSAVLNKIFGSSAKGHKPPAKVGLESPRS
jgi:hypothetical protein